MADILQTAFSTVIMNSNRFNVRYILYYSSLMYSNAMIILQADYDLKMPGNEVKTMSVDVLNFRGTEYVEVNYGRVKILACYSTLP